MLLPVLKLKKPANRWLVIIGLPIFVIVVFYAVQYGLAFLLRLVMGNTAIQLANNAVSSTILIVVADLLVLVGVVGIPYLLLKVKTSKKEFGLNKLPTWTDILLSPAGFIVYFILAAIITALASLVFPKEIMVQAQDVGFKNLNRSLDYVFAFLALVVVAPVVEETIFRGYLFGKLKKHMPVIVAVLITSAVFGIAHGQINVGLNVFALSVVACYLREFTDSIWAGVLLHMIKNGIAFYFLFINPALLHMVG